MTLYRLATTPADYRKCRALVRSFAEPKPMTFPTVMAVRDGRVIGVLGTQSRNDMVVAGPFVLAHKSPFVVLHLLDAYDLVMRRAGIVAYHFYIDPGNAHWQSQVERLGFVAWAKDELGGAWYRRTLKPTLQEANHGREN